MKISLFVTTIVAASLMIACTTKKNVATASATTTETKPVKPLAISIVPTELQLTAIQQKYPAATMQTLQNGYSIFTGACTNCHGQYNIYKRSEASWKHEVDDMAPRAEITDAQKNDLYTYILAMKATQQVEGAK